MFVFFTYQIYILIIWTEFSFKTNMQGKFCLCMFSKKIKYFWFDWQMFLMWLRKNTSVFIWLQSYSILLNLKRFLNKTSLIGFLFVWVSIECVSFEVEKIEASIFFGQTNGKTLEIQEKTYNINRKNKYLRNTEFLK